jgi:hypothetical protein
MADQAVIVRFTNSLAALSQLSELEDRIETLLSESRLGTYDGCDVPSDYLAGYLYFHGPDASALFQVIQPTLEAFSSMDGAIVRLRHGRARKGVREECIELKSTHAIPDGITTDPTLVLPRTLAARTGEFALALPTAG